MPLCQSTSNILRVFPSLSFLPFPSHTISLSFFIIYAYPNISLDSIPDVHTGLALGRRILAPVVDVSALTEDQHPSRHIEAPFDLRRDRGALSSPSNHAFFDSIFPHNKGYATDGFFVCFKSTPPRS